ncbi:MAG: hypothetical protein FJ265_06975 [Planctomycetes bacterium]|nr:hypothetical protein [Planctomycetota bacterium]
MKLLPPFVLALGLCAQDPAKAPVRAPMLLPQAVVLPRGETEIAVDGTLSDWPELPALRLDDQRQISGTATGAWNGPKDASAVAFLLWDPQFLYVAFAVKDEWHRALDAETLQLSEVPVADSVVLTFDPDRNTRSNGPDPGRAEDREFWLADEPAREVVQWDRLRGTARVLDAAQGRVVVLHDLEHGLTTYEARLAWEEILPAGRKAEAGTVLDLQIVVDDFDESTDPMPQTRIGWTFGVGPVVDPGLLGSIMLVADQGALQGKVPQFPPKPAVAPQQPVGDWEDLTARLLKTGPAVHDGARAPEEAGGLQRFAVLEEIDGHCERFPRVDFVALHQRIHRRMLREVAGMQARGLPHWWAGRLTAVSAAAAEPIPNGTVRLFRVPMGGWLVGTPTGGFGVDLAGSDLAENLWGRTEFCVLTRPLDITFRNDQLLLRMMTNKPPRAVLTHIAFHLPVVQMADMPLVEPGTTFGPPAGVSLHALGSKTKDGKVPWSCSYRMSVPNGPRLMWVGPTLQPAEVGTEPVDAMVASPRNPALLEIVRRVAPGLVVLDDAFLCSGAPGVQRISLRDLYQLQKAMQPQRSLLLAPGEGWDIPAPR